MARKYHYENVRENEFTYYFGAFQVGIAILMGLGFMYGIAFGVIYNMSGLMIICNIIIMVANGFMGANNLESGIKTKKVRVYDPEPPKPGKKVDDDTARKIMLGK